MVEFALVAPVFFLLLFGTIEGGRFILGLDGGEGLQHDVGRQAASFEFAANAPNAPPFDTGGGPHVRGGRPAIVERPVGHE